MTSARCTVNVTTSVLIDGNGEGGFGDFIQTAVFDYALSQKEVYEEYGRLRCQSSPKRQLIIMSK